MSRRCPSALLPKLLAAVLAVLLGPAARAGEPDGAARVDPSLGPRVTAAVEDAARRLEERPCALVLTDFSDSRTGLTLAESLAATGRTASEHVRSLLFLGSRSLKPFPGRTVFAFTTPTSRVVTLGREDVFRVQAQRRLLTAVLIHEVLHTLGLRDDRPSPVAITERVLERCF